MKRFFLVLFLLFSGSALAQLATPTFNLASSGSFSATNAVYDPIFSPSGTTVCWSTNGTTPTAAVAGTCDAGFYSATNQAGCYFSSSGTCKVIATKLGSTNSAVASAVYTITQSAATNPISVPTPIKVTSATTNIIDELPAAANVNGTVYLFYTEGTSGVTIDNGGTGRVMFKTTTNGTSFTAPASTSFCQAGDPANGCLFNPTSTTYGNIAAGMAVTTSNTLLVFIVTWTSGTTANGIYECRLPSGGSWNCFPVVTPSFPAVNNFQNPTTNGISIAAGESGVTGSCFTSGCTFISVRQGIAGVLGNIFSYDDGLTWSDPVPMDGGGAGLSYPYITEEHATIRLPHTTELMAFSRPSGDFPVNGGPTPVTFQSSPNLGTSWNGYVVGSTTFLGNASNLPLSTCTPAPMTSWEDTWTQPSVIQDPANPALYTMLYGERFSCSSPSATHYQWQIVTFNGASAYSGNGLNLPLSQVLDFNTVSNNPCVTGTANPHTTYSRLVALNSTQALMFYECGTAAPLEDIYATILSYAPGMQTGGGVKYWSPAIAFK